MLRPSQRPQSPDRARQAALLGGGLGGAGQPSSRVVRAGSASACQLLVLSPHGSSSGEQVQGQRLARPVSAPKSRSRLSPPRRQHV